MPPSCLALTLLLVVAAGGVGAQQEPTGPEYVKAVEAWRAKHEADYTREFVPLAGLFFLQSGANAVGSASSNAIRLPERAPATVGRIIYRRGEVRFEPTEGVELSLGDDPIEGPVRLRPAEDDRPADEVGVYDISFWAHASGDRMAIRLRDPQGRPARLFEGFRWFPIDPQYRVMARFIPDRAPRQVQVPNLMGDRETYTTEGVVEFVLAGRTVQLRPMTTAPGRLFFVFRDATAGRETYEAARFLYADLLPDGTTILDFNQAYNPPCAFNAFTTCPLPPAENRLQIPIRAGELNYPNPPKLP